MKPETSSATEVGERHAAPDRHGDHVHGLFTVTINASPIEVHRGRHTVSELKRLGEVPQADILAQILDGRVMPLPADGHVEIHGGEKFISYPPDSGSSWR